MNWFWYKCSLLFWIILRGGWLAIMFPWPVKSVWMFVCLFVFCVSCLIIWFLIVLPPFCILFHFWLFVSSLCYYNKVTVFHESDFHAHRFPCHFVSKAQFEYFHWNWNMQQVRTMPNLGESERHQNQSWHSVPESPKHNHRDWCDFPAAND